MASIEIDGKKVDAEPGMMIIEAADAHNIWIPRFCYHKKLSIAANCRMCLVEVEKSGKPLPACATPITDGMKVFTKSKKALMAQKGVMEFLLINHPLDCPICDQGGECELQDISMGYGNDVSRFTEKKRVVKDKNIGPLISTDMTRCIQCTRCVRFGTEIAGVRELGAVGRGEHMEIGTFIERNVESEVSGNVIDLCPVGALTSKPYRFTARGWELQQRPSIAAHDCIGSNIYVHTLRDKVMRVVPRENEEVNEVWISDRDRFSYEGLNVERLESPKIKRDGQFETVTWAEALEYVVECIQNVIQKEGSESLGALLSPNATTEEAYLLQKLIRGLGSNNIDHRLRQMDFRGQEAAPAFPNMGLPLSELEHQSLVLLVGSLIRQEQPVLGLKLRKMTQAAGSVIVINPIDCEFNFEVAQKILVTEGDLFNGLAKVVKALWEGHSVNNSQDSSLKGSAGKETANTETVGTVKIHTLSPEALKWLSALPKPDEKDHQIAKALVENEKSVILLGSLALNHPDASRLIALATLIQEMTGAKVGTLTEGANAAGAWLAGAVPHRLPSGEKATQPGLNATEIWSEELKAYFLLNLEPDLDVSNPLSAMNAIKHADCVVAITPFQSAGLEAHADILLPSTPFTETSGTFINAEGRWQTFKAVTQPFKDSRPAWKILRVLGNLFDLPGFDYTSSEEILSELKQEQHHGFSLENWDFWTSNDDDKHNEHHEHHGHHEHMKTEGLMRLGSVPIYACDNVVRRAMALQNTDAAQDVHIRVNHKTAERLGVSHAKQVKIESVKTEHVTREYAKRENIKRASVTKEDEETDYLKAKPVKIKHVEPVILPLILDDTVPENVAVVPLGLKQTAALGAPYQQIILSPWEGG